MCIVENLSFSKWLGERGKWIYTEEIDSVENGDIFGFGCESKEDNWPTDTI